MKHNSKQFLALFVAASMAVTPVSGVYAEDQDVTVENAVSDNSNNTQESRADGQNEVKENTSSEEETAGADNNTETVKSQTENHTTGSGQTTAGNVQNPVVSQESIQNTGATQSDDGKTDVQAEKDAADTDETKKKEAFEKLLAISGTAEGLKDGTYNVAAKKSPVKKWKSKMERRLQESHFPVPDIQNCG